MLKSVGAVLAGLITIIVLSNGTDSVLESTGVFPSVAQQRATGFTTLWMVLLALGYRVLFMVLGGFVTAKLAPDRPMRHAVILGVIGVAIGILGTIATPGVVPLWFSAALVVLGLPCVAAGARLAGSTGRSRPTAG